MVREAPFFSFILVLTHGAFLFLQPFARGKDLRREVTCFSDFLHLDCGKNSIIAIHDAFFTTEKHRNQTCIAVTTSTSHSDHEDYIEDEETVTLPTNYSICYEDIRLSINRKCSGHKSCNYTYHDQPERICSSPEGYFVVTYDCARESIVNKYCNSKASVPEGYIASPAYPVYSPKLAQCSWTFTYALEGQWVRLQIIHMNLRPATEITPTLSDHESHLGVYGAQMTSEVVTRCDDDRLTLMEGIVKKESLCGEDLDSLKTVELDAGAGAEIRFRSVAFLPGGGFLAYYKVEGCPTLAAGESSHLLERNGSYAVYGCRHKNQIFNDTLKSTRTLHCVRNHHWNESLPPCIALDDSVPMTSQNSTTEGTSENGTLGIHGKVSLADRSPGLLEDIILPSAIIATLLLVNVIILITIFACRRRQKSEPEEKEEMNKLQPSHLATEEDFDDDLQVTEEAIDQAKPGTSKKHQEPIESRPSTSTSKEETTQV